MAVSFGAPNFFFQGTPPSPCRNLLREGLARQGVQHQRPHGHGSGYLQQLDREPTTTPKPGWSSTPGTALPLSLTRARHLGQLTPAPGRLSRAAGPGQREPMPSPGRLASCRPSPGPAQHQQGWHGQTRLTLDPISWVTWPGPSPRPFVAALPLPRHPAPAAPPESPPARCGPLHRLADVPPAPRRVPAAGGS